MSSNHVKKRGPYKVGVERRKSIIKQASATFAQNGYYGGTMKDVAERVGVTPAALGRYFANKEELLVAVLDHNLGLWRKYVDEAAGPDRRGLDYFRGLPKVVEYLERNPGTARVMTGMYSEGSDPSHPAYDYVQTSHARTKASFTRHVTEAVEDGEIPRFTREQIELEAAQLAVMLLGSTSEVVVLAGSPPDRTGPSASESHAAFIENTIARWRAMRAFEGSSTIETKQ